MKADHDQVTRLLKTARGQIDGILKMVEEDSCVRQAVVSGDPEEKLNELALLLDKLAD